MVSVKRAALFLLSLLLIALANVPARAQTFQGETPELQGMDLAGGWTPVRHEDAEVDRAGGPPPGDYTGLPINDANRMRADTYHPSLITLPIWVCRPHPSGFENMGPDFQFFEKVIDPISREIIAWRIMCNFCTLDRWIWMDGRPHPPAEALHTWEGFSTGEWDGNTLVVTVTHLKESYIRRDGLSEGPRATVTEYFTRHGDYLDWTSIVDDPDYLTEPLIRNQTYLRFAGPTPPPWNCTPQTELPLPRGAVPHYLPGKNPDLTEYSSFRKVPFIASRGGAETQYPEYQAKLKDMPMTAPAARVVNGFYQPDYDKAPTLKPLPKNPEFHVMPVRGNIYLIVGAGANITASVGPDGVILVDTGNGTKTDEILKAVQEVAKQQATDRLPGFRYVRPDSPRPAGAPAPAPIRSIISTSADVDHLGGNARILESSVFHPFTNGMRVIGHLAILNRTNNLPKNEQPTDTYDTPYLKLQPYTNGDAIQIVHMPAAHTDGDSVVWFRGADVISTGDLFVADEYPVIDLDKGGTIQGLIDALNNLVDLAFPGYMSQEGTLLIPGHGRIIDSADLAYYQNMVTIIRDRIKDMKSKGMSLEQVKAAKPTFDYDPVYGHNPGSPDRFVEQVYRSLRE